MKQCRCFVFDMRRTIEEKFNNIIKKKADIIELLLVTINYIQLSPSEMSDNSIDNLKINSTHKKVVVLYGKINRIFYCLNNRIVSISIPFQHKSIKERNTCIKYHIFKDYDTNLTIDSELINYLNLLLKNHSSIEKIMDILNQSNYEYKKWEDVLKVFNKLLSYDTGYLRYDYDKERANPNNHPCNHIDVNFDDRSSFKLGLSNKCSCQELISIIDKNDKVRYLTDKL